MEENNIYTLYDEGGIEYEFEHLDTVKLGEEEYCVFAPVSEDEELGVVIMKIETDDSGEKVLASVEDSDIIDSVYDIFKERNADLFDFED